MLRTVDSYLHLPRRRYFSALELHAVAIGTIAAVVFFIGYGFGVEPLQTIIPGFPAMRPRTAFAFMAAVAELPSVAARDSQRASPVVADRRRRRWSGSSTRCSATGAWRRMVSPSSRRSRARLLSVLARRARDAGDQSRAALAHRCRDSGAARGDAGALPHARAAAVLGRAARRRQPALIDGHPHGDPDRVVHGRVRAPASRASASARRCCRPACGAVSCDAPCRSCVLLPIGAAALGSCCARLRLDGRGAVRVHRHRQRRSSARADLVAVAASPRTGRAKPTSRPRVSRAPTRRLSSTHPRLRTTSRRRRAMCCSMANCWKRRSPRAILQQPASHASSIRDSALEMPKIIDGMLDYSRAPPSPASASPTIRSASSSRRRPLSAPPISRRRARSVTVLHEVRLRCDSTLMTTVLQNLIANAIKNRRRDRPLAIRIDGVREEAGWRISVEDNGVGFDPDFAAVAFNPLARGVHTAGRGRGHRPCRPAATSSRAMAGRSASIPPSAMAPASSSPLPDKAPQS